MSDNPREPTNVLPFARPRRTAKTTIQAPAVAATSLEARLGDPHLCLIAETVRDFLDTHSEGGRWQLIMMLRELANEIEDEGRLWR
jgi:hypothetical protein